MRLGRFLMLVCLMALPAETYAQISLAVTTEVDSVKAPDLAVTIRVTNSGKESAHKLRPAVQAGTTKIAVPELLELKPNQSHQFSASVRSDSAKTGTYPLFVTLAYADANGYNFSAIATNSYSAREASSSDIFGILTAEPVGDEGQLRLKLKNNSLQQQQVTLTPFLPAELTPQGLPATATLPPGSEQEFTGRITNFSALGGSRYPVFIAAEYETADRHFTSVITTMVDVVPRGTSFTVYRNWLIGLGIILFLAAIWKMTRPRKSRGYKSESARVGDSRP
jgi:hypothetical protein